MKARKIALEILNNGISNFFVSPSIWKMTDSLTEQDRSFVRKLVYGTLRYSLSIDREVSKFLKDPKRTPEDIRSILRMGTYEIIEMRIPAYATVNEYTKIAPLKFKGLVNAVLRRISEHATDIKIDSGFPEWLIALLNKDLKEDFEIFLSKSEYHEISLRVTRKTREELEKIFADRSVESYPMKFSQLGLKCPDGTDLKALSSFENGDFTFQDESSQMICSVVNPKPGEKILDAFGGVGTKTTHLIQVEPRSVIYYNDLNRSKTSAAIDNFKRLKLFPSKIMNTDVLSDKFDEKFQKILVDAPCTALGTLGKHPDLLLRLKPEDVKEKSQTQFKMLERLWNLLESHGEMIYSVCTVTKDETDSVISEFLQMHPEAKAIDPFDGKFDFKFNGLGVQLLKFMEGFYISKLVKLN